MKTPNYRIDVLENFSVAGVAYYEGEKSRAVDQAVAETACGAGWAKDVAGSIATGERDTGPKKLAVKPIGLGVKASKPGISKGEVA